MKPIFKYILLMALAISSCSKGLYPEGELIKTKIYVGKYIQSYPHEKFTSIETTQIVVLIKDNPEIPDSAWCYVKRRLCKGMHPDLAWQLEEQWFTWNGTDKLYPIKQNIKFNPYD